MIREESMRQWFQPLRKQGAIDLIAFLGQWPNRLLSYASVSDLIAMADRYELTGICVSHIASVHGHDTRSGNEALFVAATADERLWPFAMLNPAAPGRIRPVPRP